MPRLVLTFLLFGAGCGGREVTARLTIPNLDGVETPLPGVVVTFLPYDRDSVIASLEARATPRPHTETLDSLFAAFRAPFLDFVRLQAMETRLTQERDSLAAANGATDRLTALRDSLTRLAPRIAQSRADLEEARRRYWPAMDSLRHGVQQWRAEAFAGYDTLVRQLPGRRLANPVADTTGPSGWASAELTRGRWWVTAESLDPTDPNAEWYWNLPVESDTVFLNPRTGRRRPRY